MDAHTFEIMDKVLPKISEAVKATKIQKGSETEVDIYLNAILPQIIGLYQTVFADKKVNITELIRVITAVSRLVVNLDVYSDKSEKVKVIREIMQTLSDEVSSQTPGLKDDIFTAKNLDGLIHIVYHLGVK